MPSLDQADIRAFEILTRLQSREGPVRYQAYIRLMNHLGFSTHDAETSFDRCGGRVRPDLVIDFTRVHEPMVPVGAVG